MQNPETFQQIKPHFPEQEQLKCPRCESANTKFCYYNNYNLSQPRHYCKNCRRYWTKGGSLRNIPVGGGSRKNTKRAPNNKRSSSSSSAPGPTLSAQNSGLESEPTRVYASLMGQDRRLMEDIPGSFSSLLASNGQFGSLLEGLNPGGPGVKMGQLGDLHLNSDHGLKLDSGRNLSLEEQNSTNSESYLDMQNGDSSCWNGGGNGWPDLAIYTPGSSFQ